MVELGGKFREGTPCDWDFNEKVVNNHYYDRDDGYNDNFDGSDDDYNDSNDDYGENDDNEEEREHLVIGTFMKMS